MFMLDCLVGVRNYIGSSVSRKSLPAKADKRAAVFNYDDATAKTFLAWPRGAGSCSFPLQKNRPVLMIPWAWENFLNRLTEVMGL